MPYPIGRGVKVEVQSTVGSAKTVSAISQANPGVATSTAHGLADGSVGYFSGVSGMTPMDGQAIRIDNPLTNTFELQNYDTTNQPAFAGSCSFFPVSAWLTLSNSTGYSIGGGEGDTNDQTTLIDDYKQETQGLLAAQTVTVNGLSAFNATGMAKVIAAAQDSTPLVFRVTLKDGQQRVFRGVPSLPGEDAQVGQNLTGSFSIKVTGRVLFLPAVA